MEIKNTESIRQILSDEIDAIKKGESTPARANSIANMVGKILSSVKVDIEVHRYVAKADTKDLPVTLIGQKSTK